MIVVDVNTIAYLWIPGEMTALAEDLNVPLVTSDKAIIRAFPSLAISPRVFCTK